MKYIAKQKRLERLALGNNKIGDNGMKELLQLADLQSLSLPGTEVTDAGLKDIGKLKNLKGMTVPPLVTADGLKQIAKLPCLEGLAFRESRITADGFKAALAPLKKNLDRLHLLDSEVTDEDFQSIEALKGLQLVSLAGSKITTDQGLTYLKKLPKLWRLGFDENGYYRQWAGAFGETAKALTLGLDEDGHYRRGTYEACRCALS